MADRLAEVFVFASLVFVTALCLAVADSLLVLCCVCVCVLWGAGLATELAKTMQ